MGYTFNCDRCNTRYDYAPAFMGEFRETFLKTSDSPLVHEFGIGETVTLCRRCCEDQLL